jgi:hypothetical protein
MKSNMTKCLAVMAMLTMGTITVNAQGFFKKLSEGIDKVTKTTEQVVNTASTVTEALPADSTSQKKIDWSKIPVFTTTSVTEVDAEGKPVLNEDGTPRVRVFLVDQFGNKRSAESVKAQHQAISKAIGTVLKNVGIGAGLGALTQVAASGKVDAKTALSGGIGAGVGLLASADDIKLIKQHKKSLKQQEKLIEVYQKTFTAEGTPVNAKADLSKVEGIDFTKGEKVSMASAEVKEMLESEGFNDTDVSAWDIDSL